MPTTVQVPLKNEVLEIDTSDTAEFIENAASILHILNTEQVPLPSYVELSLEYAKIGQWHLALEFAAAGLKKLDCRLYSQSYLSSEC
jgi:hypothetical protein